MTTRTAVIIVSAVAVCAAGLLLPKQPATPAPSCEPEFLKSETPVSTERNSALSGWTRKGVPRLSRSRPASVPVLDETASLVAAIQEAFASADSEARELALTKRFPDLVLRAPLAAARLAEAETSSYREVLLRRVAQLWAVSDPESALAWASQLPDEAEKNSAVRDVCFRMAQDNPEMAVRTCEGFPSQDQSRYALEILVQQWAQQDVPAALGWIMERPAGEGRDPFIARLAFVQAQNAPTDAATLVAVQMSPGTEQAEAAISVLHQWAVQDLASAAAWVEQFPEGPLRDRATRELAGLRQYQMSSTP